LDEKRVVPAGFWRKLRIFSVGLSLSILLTGLFSCGRIAFNDEYQLAKDVFHLVNLHRTSIGLNKLEWNEIISGQCQIHSENMASGAVGIGHAGLEQRAFDIYEKVPFTQLYENVGYVADLMGISSPASRILEEWLKSPEHSVAIEGTFDLTGVGVVVDGAEYYFTQIFIKTN
jgi:uncharacterized protein YkwD